jgi:arsenate reductase (glutaredoxin)
MRAQPAGGIVIKRLLRRARKDRRIAVRIPDTGTVAMITIYHNPRCTKSRGACELVNERLAVAGEPIKIIEYLKEPPSVDELKALHKMLGGSVRDMIRDNEAPFKELKLGEPTVTDDQLYEAIAAHPILLQRPIVVRDDRAVIGRPPENVDALFK